MKKRRPIIASKNEMITSGSNKVSKPRMSGAFRVSLNLEKNISEEIVEILEEPPGLARLQIEKGGQPYELLINRQDKSRSVHLNIYILANHSHKFDFSSPENKTEFDSQLEKQEKLRAIAKGDTRLGVTLFICSTLLKENLISKEDSLKCLKEDFGIKKNEGCEFLRDMRQTMGLNKPIGFESRKR